MDRGLSGRRAQRRLRGRAGRGARREGGYLAALEAVFVGVLLITSIAIVSTLNTAPPSIAQARDDVQDDLKDLLFGLEDLPTGDRYNFQMEKAVMKAAVGNTTALQSYIRKALPAGTECRLWLDNGKTSRLLAGTQEQTTRERVSAARLYRPQFAYSLVLPSLDVVTPDMPLDVQGYGVSRGTLVKENGVPVQVVANTTEGDYTAAAITSVKEGAVTASLYMLNETGGVGFNNTDTTVIGSSVQVYRDVQNGMLNATGNFTVPSDAASLDLLTTFQGLVVSVNLNLTDPNNQSYLYVASAVAGITLNNWTVPSPLPGNWTVKASGTLTGDFLLPAKSNLTIKANSLVEVTDWTLVLRAERGTIPTGTNLTYRLPFPDFVDTHLTSASQAGWRNIQGGGSMQNGTWVKAELSTDLAQGSTRGIVIHANRQVRNALYLGTAELGNGTTGRATLALGMPFAATESINPVQRGLYVSLPKPIAPSTTSVWNALFTYPSTAIPSIAVPVANETVRRVDFTVVDGQPVFGSVEGLSPPGTWIVLSPTHLRWTGNLSVAPNTAVSFAAKVTTGALPSAHEPALAMPLQFTGSGFEMKDQARPYVFRGTFPPGSIDRAGFENPPRPAATADNPVPTGRASAGVSWSSRGQQMTGNLTYDVADYPQLDGLSESIRLGLARSHLTISKPQVRLGEELNVTVDFQGMFDLLRGKVLQPLSMTPVWEVRLAIADPAQAFESYGNWRWSFDGYFGTNASWNGTLNDWTITSESWLNRSASDIVWALRDSAGPPPQIWPRNIQEVESLDYRLVEPPWKPLAALFGLGGSERLERHQLPTTVHQVLDRLPAAPIPTWVLETADVHTQGNATFTFRPPQGGFYGPHAVIAEATFMMTDPTTGNELWQTARLVGVIDVVPDGGQSGSALYWVNLECWQPDW